MSFLDELQTTHDTLAGTVGRSVVGVGAGGWRAASGVVIAPGKVLTSTHAARDGQAAVTFGDGRSATGSVTASDPDLGLCVLDVDTGDAPALALTTGPAARAGAPVFALANPAGRGLRVTFGVISATGQRFRGPRGRRVEGSIEHSAPLPRGSSGGPLVTPAGEVIGLNAARASGGLILAHTLDEALAGRIEALARGEEPRRRTLGVAIAPPRAARRLRRSVGLPDRDGLLVHGVADGSPAEQSGIARGDLIVGAQGQPVSGTDALYAALDGLGDGDALELDLVRGTDERRVSVTFEPIGG
jgi:S1-C subfamily serine protease